MRKVIKQEKGNEGLNAKQIMKIVSKRWQTIKDNLQKTEMYEYLSLRDRESYADLKSFWDKRSKEQSSNLKPNVRASPHDEALMDTTNQLALTKKVSDVTFNEAPANNSYSRKRDIKKTAKALELEENKTKRGKVRLTTDKSD